MVGDPRPFLAPETDPVGSSVLHLFTAGDHPVVTAALQDAVRHGPTDLRLILSATDEACSAMIAPAPTDNDPDAVTMAIRHARAEVSETAAKQSALHLALVQAISEIVWHKDVSTGRIERNGWCQFTGQSDFPSDEWSWLDVIHTEDREHIREAAELADRNGTPLSVQYRLWHHTGEWRWVVDHAVPIIEAGQVTDWVGIVTDIHARWTAEAQLQESESRLRLAMHATGLGTWEETLGTAEVCWSAEMKAMFGLPSDAVPPQSLLSERVSAEDREELKAFWAGLASAPGELGSVVVRLNPRERHTANWIHLQGMCLADETGNPTRCIGIAQDVTEHQKTRDALKLALRRHEALVAATSEIVWLANPDQTEGDGTGWSEFTGQSLEDANGEGWLAAVHPEDRDRARQTCEIAVAEGKPYTNEYRLWHRSGEWRWVLDRVVPLRDDHGSVAEWVGIIADIHEQKLTDVRIRRAALTDPLTGIANRAAFHAGIEKRRSLVDAGATALMLIDLDRFKEVNDSLGHDAGDEALRIVAERLTAEAPPSSLVARLGGDEFGLLVPVRDEADARAIAARILARVNRPYQYGLRDLECSSTVGYAIHPLHDPDFGSLLKNADMALYAAKSEGRGLARPFNKTMREEFNRRLIMMRIAREALAEDRIMPFYQPKVSLAGDRLIGFEALLRWQDDSGLRGPDTFSEAFCDSGLAARLGRRMLDRICRDMVSWRAAGVPFGHVALNVSAAEFLQPDFADDLLEALDTHALPTSLLEVEVTESVLLESGNRSASRALERLHAAGVSIALDDFGTGYASLTHLKRFPVSWLKIDRSFVSNLEVERDSAAIVTAVIGMAHNLGIRVVAEGVETPWQRDFLARNGCTAVQGYLVARPMPAASVPEFVGRQSEV